jgi:hypothetical protein
MKSKILLVAAVLAGAAAWMAWNTDSSRGRYARLLLANLPRMPFRYFV